MKSYKIIQKRSQRGKREDKEVRHKTNCKMSDLHLTDIATIILNVNGLNTPIKRQRLATCI